MDSRTEFDRALDAISAGSLRERGHANVFLAGRAGVGKSTLVNAVFDGDLARVGQGRPVTRHTRVYGRPHVPISLYDNRGLELAEFHAIMADQERCIREANGSSDPDRHIHVGWICIAEDLRRVEDAEIEMTRMLARHMPVIAVITKARADRGFQAAVERLLPEARAVVRVRALEEELDDGHTLSPFGLGDLVKVTGELFPEGQRRAFVAAQRVDLALKREAARWIVLRHAAYAAGNAANPVPFADQLGLAAVFSSMFMGISSAYGLSPSARTLAVYLAAAVGAPTTTLSASLFASSLLKCIPGLGTFLGQALNVAVAPAVTTTIGMAYVELLHGLYSMHSGRSPREREVVDALRDDFRDHVARQRRSGKASGQAPGAGADQRPLRRGLANAPGDKDQGRCQGRAAGREAGRSRRGKTDVRPSRRRRTR
jgi:uncharacterized protein (DUF697 family)